MHTVADPAGLRQQPQFQTTVEALAQKAHAALPLAHGRIEKAVAIVPQWRGHAPPGGPCRDGWLAEPPKGLCGAPELAASRKVHALFA